MKKRVIIACAAILLAVTGCTAAVAAAAGKDSGEEAGDEADAGAQDGYVLTKYGDGIGVFKGEELIITSPVDLDTLRDVDRELIMNGIETESYDDVLKLLEDFNS